MLGLEPPKACGAGFNGGIAWMAEFRIDIVCCEKKHGYRIHYGAYRATCIALENSSQIILGS
jgi:hypothetical protein